MFLFCKSLISGFIEDRISYQLLHSISECATLVKGYEENLASYSHMLVKGGPQGPRNGHGELQPWPRMVPCGGARCPSWGQ